MKESTDTRLVNAFKTTLEAMGACSEDLLKISQLARDSIERLQAATGKTIESLQGSAACGSAASTDERQKPKS